MNDFPEGLLTAIRERTLVPFVGAGLSRSVGADLFPDWAGLLEKFAVRLDDEQRAAEAVQMRALIVAKELVEAAEYARANMRAGWFDDVMRRSFFRTRPPNANLTTVGAVWRLQPRLVITTNFEQVLEWPLGMPADWPYAPPLARPIIVHNDDQPELREIAAPAFPDDAPRIWHLHGSVNRLKSIVLTTSEFTTLYGEPAAGGAPPSSDHVYPLTVFRQILATRPLLFIGFSLSDPFVLHHIRAVLELTADRSATSYMLVHQNEAVDPALFRKYGIQPVTFEDFGAPMTARLQELVDTAWSVPAMDVKDLATPMVPLILQLEPIVSGIVPEPAAVADAFNAVRPDGWPAFPGVGDGLLLLRSAVVRLSHAALQHASGSHPLLAFIKRLAASQPAFDDALDDWVESAINALGRDANERDRIRRAVARDAGQQADVTTPYVLVRILEVHPEPVSWSVQAWLYTQGPGSVPEMLFESETQYAANDSIGLVNELLVRLLNRNLDEKNAVIAFLVPRTLLCEAIDAWRPAPPPSWEPALGAYFTVTVRPSERWTNPLLRPFIQRNWEALKGIAGGMLQLVDAGALGDDPGARAVWLSGDEKAGPAMLTRFRKSRVPCAVLATPPPRRREVAPGLFDAVLDSGIPVVIWTRDAERWTAASLRAQIEKLFGETHVLELPRRLRDIVASPADDDDDDGCRRLALIWDAAEFPPPDHDQDNRAVL